MASCFKLFASEVVCCFSATVAPRKREEIARNIQQILSSNYFQSASMTRVILVILAEARLKILCLFSAINVRRDCCSWRESSFITWRSWKVDVLFLFRAACLWPMLFPFVFACFLCTRVVLSVGLLLTRNPPAPHTRSCGGGGGGLQWWMGGRQGGGVGGKVGGWVGGSRDGRRCDSAPPAEACLWAALMTRRGEE